MRVLRRYDVKPHGLNTYEIQAHKDSGLCIAVLVLEDLQKAKRIALRQNLRLLIADKYYNPRYAAYAKLHRRLYGDWVEGADHRSMHKYTAWIGGMKRTFTRIHSDKVSDVGQILDHDAFTRFIQRRVKLKIRSINRKAMD